MEKPTIIYPTPDEYFFYSEYYKSVKLVWLIDQLD